MAEKQCCSVAKLSPNKKSIFGLRNQILSFIFFACFLADVASGLDTDVSCSNVRSAYESIGMLPAVDILDQPNSDAGGLCLNRGCCAASARPRLTQLARTQLETSLRSELTKLADILANQGRKFDEFFRKLLQQSRENFHAMFKRTYGMIYEQHSYVFEQLFVQLERYYARGDTDLDNIMDRFFGILYQKMFTVLNAQYSFDEKYLKCVGEHMRETQPFDDVPHKLSVQLRRAFVATRTFHKALRAGAEVVRNMQQVGVSPECIVSWTRLRHCGACGGGGGGGGPPACSRYCHNVLRGCLAAQADLAPHWDAYVDAVEKVADRLMGPFNIVMVVEPIDIKISEAIMNFQEHNPEISQKIFSGCGKPVLGGPPAAGPFYQERTRRSARSIPDFDWNHKANDVDDFEIETSFETLMKEDPTLFSRSSPRDIDETAKKMARQAEDREKFLQYMKGDIDAEEYEEHERMRRDADPEPAPASSEIDYRSYDFDGKRGKGKGKKPASSKADSGRDFNQWGSQSLVRLVRDTRNRVRSSRRSWAALPYVLCSEPALAAPPAPLAVCFNGSHTASYSLPAAGEGSAALASNPEVRGAGAGAGAGAALLAQQEQLKSLTARLKNAYNGVEVQWRDDDDDQIAAQTFDVAETAGSGSGSGENDDNLPDDDEDREGTDYPASGEGPLDTDVRYTAPPPPPAAATPAPPPPPPSVVGGGGDSRNVRLNAPLDDPELNSRYGDDTSSPPAGPPPPAPPGRDAAGAAGAAGAAQRPGLNKALFTYALPVVCAWFGTIVTDLV